MTTMQTWADRLANYQKETGFPQALFIADGDKPCVVGTWVMGNDYRVK